MQSVTSHKVQRWCILCLLVGQAQQAAAYQDKLPHKYLAYKEASAPAEKLDGMIVAINNVPRFVPAGSTLTFIRGDILQVREALRGDRRRKVETVNVIGYSNPQKPSLRNDLGALIDTSTQLLDLNQAVNPEAELYTAIATTGKMLYGRIFLQPIEPQLQYVEISINGEPQIARVGVPLVLSAADRFKLVKIASNISDASQVQFNILPLVEVPPELKSSLQASTYHTLVFSHKGLVFGEIPLRIEQR